MKRGQLTIFIIIAIVIIGLVILLFALRGNLFPEPKIAPEFQFLADQIQECVNDSLEGGLVLAQLQGGYIIPPENSLETNSSYIAYGHYLDKNTLPSKQKIEAEIQEYIEFSIPNCIAESGFWENDISFLNPKISVKIKKSSILTEVKYPFVVIHEEDRTKIDLDYYGEHKTDLDNMYDVAEEIIQKYIEDPDFIDFNYLINFGYTIQIFQEGDNDLVYVIFNSKSNKNSRSDFFRFASKIK